MLKIPSLQMLAAASLTLVAAINLSAQPASPPTGSPPSFAPPGFGPGGFGGPGPGMQEDLPLLKEFDKDSNGWLNTAERVAARKHLEQLRSQGGGGRPGGPGGRRGGPGGFGVSEAAPQPGAKISPAEVTNFGDAPLYASNVVRTLFLEFDSPDWEKELETFYRTDVEVPAKLTADGKTLTEVGVRFRGNTSYMFQGTGRKRPLNLSLDMVHEDQNLLGFRTLNLLNGAEDPSFLRTVLALQMARDYMPAPRANFIRLVINGESWGLYVNVEQFNKDFLRDHFATTKGTRWKVPGNPGGRGGLEYLGDDVTQYRRVYEIKSKDEPKAWASLMKLCKVLTETPADQLETALGKMLDIDGVLRFLAWDNVLANGDGFWTRASDYCLYEDAKGQFHLIPYDVNETFSAGGGPGGPGGFGGPGGPGGFGGRGGPPGFGPGFFLAPAILETGDKNGDARLSANELQGVADTWFDSMDTEKSGRINLESFVRGLNDQFPPPPGAGQFGPPGGGRGGFGPGTFVGPGIFAAADQDKNENLTRSELNELFARWFQEWNVSKAEALDEETIRKGLSSSLPPPDGAGFGGGPGGRRGGGQGGPGGFGGRGGPGFGGPGRGGTSLDPLVAAKDPTKPLISKLLAVPELRARYLGYVRHMAETWLDWNRLGPVARSYHELITPEVQADTRKLMSFEQFQNAVEGGDGDAVRGGSLKAFAEQRRQFLINHSDVNAATSLPPK